jgi:hypothetical protein
VLHTLTDSGPRCLYPKIKSIQWCKFWETYSDSNAILGARQYFLLKEAGGRRKEGGGVEEGGNGKRGEGLTDLWQ